MNSKAIRKQLLAAVAMVLVAAVALGSSTYAWFVSNNTVKATTSTISAQSNAPFLMIDKTAITADSLTAITFVEDPAVNKALYPAQVVKIGGSGADKDKPKFQSAYASSAVASTELTNSRYDVAAVGAVDASSKEIVVEQEFAIKESFKIGTADAKAGSFKDLKVSKVELTSTGTAGLEKAMSILVICGDNWAVYKASDDGAVLTAYKDGTSAAGNNTSGVLASTISAGSSNAVSVDVYVFYDGSETNVYTNNLSNLTAIGATITFTATPVNTQGTEVNAPNPVEPLGTPTATASFAANKLTVSSTNVPTGYQATGYSWKLNGQEVAITKDYTLTEDSQNGKYTCTVTYTSGTKTITATSAEVDATYTP